MTLLHYVLPSLSFQYVLAVGVNGDWEKCSDEMCE